MKKLIFIAIITLSTDVFGAAVEPEGSIKSVYLASYQYDPLPEGWETKGIKAKAQEACEYAFTKLGSGAQSLFACSKTGEGPGQDRTILYKFAPKPDLDTSIPHSPSRKTFGILSMYHFRADGRLPRYKDGIFSNRWVAEQYEKIVGEAASEDLYLMNVVSVMDASNNVDLHVISRSDRQLGEASWILRRAFGLFESPIDELESETCILLQKLSLQVFSGRSSRALEEKLEDVEGKLKKLKGVDESF